MDDMANVLTHAAEFSAAEQRRSVVEGVSLKIVR